MSNFVLTDELFEEELNKAKRYEELYQKQKFQVQFVTYKQDGRTLLIELKNKVKLFIPISLISELKSLSDDELKDVNIFPLGDTLYWEKQDIHISVYGLITKCLSLDSWMESLIAKKKGQVKSEAKSISSKENGSKGGRPKLDRDEFESYVKILFPDIQNTTIKSIYKYIAEKNFNKRFDNTLKKSKNLLDEFYSTFNLKRKQEDELFIALLLEDEKLRKNYLSMPPSAITFFSESNKLKSFLKTIEKN